jgi:predicted O-methyltransferase YrrM
MVASWRDYWWLFWRRIRSFVRINSMNETPELESKIKANEYLKKMLIGARDIYVPEGSITPCHTNSLGQTKSVPWETGIILKNFVEYKKPRVIVELGTFRGYSTSWLILGTLLNGFGWVTTFDVQPEGFFGKMWYDFYDLPKNLFSFEHIPGGIWRHSERSFIPGTIDLLFHDSSHELDDTKKEMEILLPRIPAGGIALFDDMLYPDYGPMQSYLHNLFLSMPNWKWSVLPIGTGLGIAERIR